MHLLLIEDDFDLGRSLQRSLDQAGFRSVWVRRLREARLHLESARFDCILLDLNLPDGEGFSLLALLRERRFATPVLVMSARNALDDRLRALNGGADDYLIKPFPVPELLARIHALIRRAAGQATSIWHVGDLSLDMQSQTVELARQPVPLTPREFGILRELAAAAGRVVRRRQLIERIWTEDDEPGEGALEFQIHGLRRKLGAERIRTVRGIGYLLVAGDGVTSPPGRNS
ncbi:MAG: response regulator [Pseudomonadota bacterium]